MKLRRRSTRTKGTARPPRRAISCLLCAAWLALASWVDAAGRPVEGNAQASESTGRSASDLAREFGDPLTTLPQLSIQNIYTPDNYGTDADTNRLLVRPIIPRLPRFRIFPLVQLLRPSFSLLTVPTGPGGNTRTEFGDIQLLDLFVLPGSSAETGLYMGLGPFVNFPTATYETAGVGAWQLGPAFGTIYKGQPGLLVGCLAQNPFSLSYTEKIHAPDSALYFQPIALVYVGHGFYVKSADSTWVYTWDGAGPRTLPLSFGIGYVWLRDDSPPLNLSIAGEWLAWRDDAPVAPRTSVRFALTVAFPEWTPWR